MKPAPDPVTAVGSLLILILLVLAPIAVSRAPARLKAALHILAGMAVGVAAGLTLGAILGNAQLAGDLSSEFMFCGGIWVSVRKIRRALGPRPGR